MVTGDGGISTIEGVFSLEDPELEELYPLLLTGLLALPPILPRDIDLWLITGEALAEFPLLTCWQGDLLKGIDNKTVRRGGYIRLHPLFTYVLTLHCLDLYLNGQKTRCNF